MFILIAHAHRALQANSRASIPFITVLRMVKKGVFNKWCYQYCKRNTKLYIMLIIRQRAFKQNVHHYTSCVLRPFETHAQIIQLPQFRSYATMFPCSQFRDLFKNYTRITISRTLLLLQMMSFFPKMVQEFSIQIIRTNFQFECFHKCSMPKVVHSNLAKINAT